MRDDKIKLVKTEAGVFDLSAKDEIEEKNLTAAENNMLKNQMRPQIVERKELFGRLKKSLRKKSASIL